MNEMNNVTLVPSVRGLSMNSKGKFHNEYTGVKIKL